MVFSKRILTNTSYQYTPTYFYYMLQIIYIIITKKRLYIFVKLSKLFDFVWNTLNFDLFCILCYIIYIIYYSM